MKVTLDISFRDFAEFVGMKHVTVYRLFKDGKTKSLENAFETKVKQTCNKGETLPKFKSVEISDKDTENETTVKQTCNNSETAKENERAKEEVSPTPPIEEKDKEKENYFPSSLTNQRFVRDTPQGTTENRVLEAIPDTEDSPVVVEGLGTRPARKAPVKTMAQLAEETRQRAQDFYYSLAPYVVTYGKEMIRDFYDYWSETNKSRTKMRWETEKTWVVELRLKRWADNNKAKKRRYGNEWSDEEEARRRRAEGAARVMRRFLQAE